MRQLFAIACLSIIATGITVISCNSSHPTHIAHSGPYRHHCDPQLGWYRSISGTHCRYEGLTRDKFYSDDPEGSDGYLFDLTHFEHPDFTEDEISDFLFAKTKRDLTFCDQYGNPIPAEAIQLLVRSQFRKLTPSERNYLLQYFPLKG